MTGIAQRRQPGPVAREIRRLIPPTLFFLVAFNLLALTGELARPGGSASWFTYATASVAALVCGKAVLLADNLPFLNRYPSRPLIWNVVWKAAIYMAVTLLIRLAEHLIRGAWHRDGLSAELAEAGFSWTHFALIQLWLGVLFLNYCAIGELMRALGKGRVLRLFFGPVTPADFAPEPPREARHG